MSRQPFPLSSVWVPEWAQGRRICRSTALRREGLVEAAALPSSWVPLSSSSSSPSWTISPTLPPLLLCEPVLLLPRPPWLHAPPPLSSLVPAAQPPPSP